MASDDADLMRGFVYLTKNNRENNSSIWFRHPSHPTPAGLLVRNAQEAWQFTADVLSQGKLWEHAVAYLKKQVPNPALVPIPASCTTADNIDGRWAARGLAHAIAGNGIGRVLLAVVNKQATEPTRGKHVPPSELIKNLVTHDAGLQPWETVVYVDDVLTWGNHIVAVDQFMGCPESAFGVTVAATDGVERKLAVKARLRGIRVGLTIDEVTVDNVAEEQ